MELGREHARAVHQHLSGKLTAVGLHLPSCFRGADRLHLRIPLKAYAVERRLIRQGKGHFVGAGQAAGGRIQGAEHRGIGLRLHLQYLVPLHQPHAGHTIGLALTHQIFQGSAVLFAKAQHKRARLTVGNTQLPAKLRVHFCAFHVQPGL